MTKEILKQVFNAASDQDIETFLELFNEYKEDFSIVTVEEQSAFLAQVKIEVGSDLISKRENLNYNCDALISTFSYYKKYQSEAYEDGRCNNHEANQVNIGNKAYGDRLGNGGPETGDGYRFRGGGFFQLTGREHYTNLAIGISEKLGTGVTPEELADHITEVYWGLLSAMAYWETFCSGCSDNFNHPEYINCVTSSINHHTDSYDERSDAYQEILELI